jgi:hypothetical protein
MEQIDVAIARQRFGEYMTAATDADATIDDVVFSVQSIPELHNENQLDKPGS